MRLVGCSLTLGSGEIELTTLLGASQHLDSPLWCRRGHHFPRGLFKLSELRCASEPRANGLASSNNPDLPLYDGMAAQCRLDRYAIYLYILCVGDIVSRLLVNIPCPFVSF